MDDYRASLSSAQYRWYIPLIYDKVLPLIEKRRLEIKFVVRLRVCGEADWVVRAGACKSWGFPVRYSCDATNFSQSTQLGAWLYTKSNQGTNSKNAEFRRAGRIVNEQWKLLKTMLFSVRKNAFLVHAWMIRWRIWKERSRVSPFCSTVTHLSHLTRT